MFFRNALMEATYKGGTPGKLTEAHEKAEHHRFKKEFLYKKPAISKEIYASRLIQHFLILQAIETQLKSLSQDKKSEINAFFSLSYLNQLWRTSAMADDLLVLGVDPNAIQKKQVAPATSRYLEHIKTLKPKELLAHFLLHVVGFIHGGSIIQSKYIKPSNQLTSYRIPAKQYDFSEAASQISETASAMGLYKEMMDKLDAIHLDESEYASVFAECTSVYETMTDIYDDLCLMHTKNSTLPYLALFAVALIAIALNIKRLMSDFDLESSTTNTTSASFI